MGESELMNIGEACTTSVNALPSSYNSSDYTWPAELLHEVMPTNYTFVCVSLHEAFCAYAYS